LTTTKQRTAFIISSNHYNSTHPDVILASITSQVPKKISPYDDLLTGRIQKMAGLPKPSIIKLGKIVTIDQRLVRRTLGKLSFNKMKKVKIILKRIFKAFSCRWF
jgi:mRNA interferase MazF